MKRERQGRLKERRHSRREMDMDDDEDRGCWDVVNRLGMPVLYILGIAAGIVGAICNGVITEYWSNLDPAVCFLYSKTATHSVVYQFGSAIAVCDWVTFGAVTAIIIAFLTGLIYVIKVRGNKKFNCTAAIPITGIFVALLVMLAVTCTMAEGMRITCTSMGLNSANNKGESCYEKLDRRKMGDKLPVQTSTLVRSALIALIFSTVMFFVITCFHLSDFYRRMLRHNHYKAVDYDDRR